MSNLRNILAVLLVTAACACADGQLQRAQSALREQGFYFAEPDGKSGPETTAAIKRFQIRNGLTVSGDLDEKTIAALMPGAPAAAQVPPQPPIEPAPAPRAEPQPKQPLSLRRSDSLEESDREFLRRESERSRVVDPAIVAPPTAIPAATDFAGIFEETPFENAPAGVQRDTLRKAQAALAREGMFRERIDGTPGGATEEAVLLYQRRRGLELTGRLDIATLSKLGLLPGQRGGPPLKPFRESNAPAERIYRGTIVR